MSTAAPNQSAGAGQWPKLPLAAWSDTYATLHRWLQIVGKVRLAHSPWVNHSWNATLYVTARGLTTSPIPYAPAGFTYQIDFDFIAHRLRIAVSDGGVAELPLEPQSVASFHRRLMRELHELGVAVQINQRPNEIADAIPFDQDETHAAYDSKSAHRYWQVLVQVDRVLHEFRSRFIGKCSPVHLFWGACDLAVTRFPGKPAPEHPGGIPNLPDWVTREAYSHAVSSCGFWPGGGGSPIDYPAFYSYAYPEPDGFADARIEPQGSFYSTDLREFILPYDSVRESNTPDEMLLRFLQSTYEAAAELGRWERAALERARDPRTAAR